jgi:hypothetical protein
VLIFKIYYIQHRFVCRPSDSTVSEDAGIETRTVATSALAVRRSNHSARSHPHSARSRPFCRFICRWCTNNLFKGTTRQGYGVSKLACSKLGSTLP